MRDIEAREILHHVFELRYETRENARRLDVLSLRMEGIEEAIERLDSGMTAVDLEAVKEKLRRHKDNLAGIAPIVDTPTENASSKPPTP